MEFVGMDDRDYWQIICGNCYGQIQRNTERKKPLKNGTKGF